MPGTKVRDASAAVPMLQSVIEFLRAHAPFSAMAPPQLEFLAKRLQSRYYASGQSVAPCGGLCIVRRGRIALPGGDADSLGTGATLHGERQGVAATDTLCLELDAAGLEALRRQSAAAAKALDGDTTPRRGRRSGTSSGSRPG